LQTPIAKNDIRLGVVVPKRDEDGFDMVSYHHVGCFQLPRKYAKISPLEFLQEYVTDASLDQSILPGKFLELSEQMENATANKAKAKAKAAAAGPDESEEMTLVAQVKAAHLRQCQQDETEPPKKKMKKGDKGKSELVKQDKLDLQLQPLVESYANHCKSTIENLKELLRYVERVRKDFYFKMDDAFD
jgi:hypothetical protein